MPSAWPSPPPAPHEPPTRAEAVWLGTALGLSLGAVPASTAAHGAVEEVAAAIATAEAATRGNKRRETGQAKLKAATGAVLGGVLHRWAGSTPLPAFRSMNKADLRGHVASGLQIKTAIETMKTLGLLTVAPGKRFALDWGNGTSSHGHATRLWPAPALLSLVSHHGMGPDTFDQDFRRTVAPKAPKVAKPLELGGLKLPGRPQRPPVFFDPRRDPVARDLARHVEEMNAYAAAVPVEGCDPPAWRRTFTERWTLGGRWTALGSDLNYQTLREDVRLASIVINGSHVVEVDIRACHLTIMHGLMALPLPPKPDLYDEMGPPRAVVKWWVTGTLGKGSPVRKWSPKTLKSAPEVGSFDPVEVGETVMARYPFLKDPAEAVKDALGLGDMADLAPASKLLTHRLMAIEAKVLTAAMDTLRVAGVLALPLHDALIVAGPWEREAVAALTEGFKGAVGIVPRVKVKRGHDAAAAD